MKMKQSTTSRYNIHTTCPICGDHVAWLNGYTNSDLVYIKTKRKTINIYHRKCIEREGGGR